MTTAEERRLIRELRRQLKNAKAGLTCGEHPGMSCSEAHENDRIQIVQLLAKRQKKENK